MKAKKAAALAKEAAAQALFDFMAAQPKPRVSKPRTPKITPAPDRKLKVSDAALAWSRGPQAAAAVDPFAIAKHPPGVVPDGGEMAMDDAVGWAGTAWAASAIGSVFAEGQAFLGYPELSILAQRPEYRCISETIATEMTRKWIKLQAAGDEDKTDEIKQLSDELARLGVQGAFRELAEQDGFFGRSHLYLDLGTTDDRDELKTPIGDGRNNISQSKVTKGSLQRLKTVEAVWTYPTNYNSSDPLRADWYKPSMWYCMGKQIHSSRLLTFVGREVPDLLKPAYSFGGLSLSQMAKPYVDNWLRTRQSVSDLIHSFSVSGLMTDLSTLMQPGSALEDRARFFNGTRDNRGLMLLDKDKEEFFNVVTPLGTLDALQAQAQEQMAAVSRIPVVKLTGIEPKGLNASSEGSIKTFDDLIAAYQARLFDDNLKRVLGFVMLSLWGAVDPAITHSWEPLRQLDEKALAEVRKLEAETGQIHVDGGVIAPIEERKRIATDEDTLYPGLDIDDVPDLKEEEEAGLEPKGSAEKLAGGEEDDDQREAA